jgi:hypothetical protein
MPSLAPNSARTVAAVGGGPAPKLRVNTTSSKSPSRARPPGFSVASASRSSKATAKPPPAAAVAHACPSPASRAPPSCRMKNSSRLPAGKAPRSKRVPGATASSSANTSLSGPGTPFASTTE